MKFLTSLGVRCLSLLAVLAIGLPRARGANPPPGSGAEISPQLELLSGVLAHTEWMKRRGPEGKGHRYFRELQAHFEPYRNHNAVQFARKLVGAGFTFDAHASFAMCLGSLPELELSRPYPADLVARVGGDARALDAFRIALRNLARESKFEEFLAKHQSEYAAWCSDAKFERERTTGWLETFFGADKNEFRMVLAPAMFPGGGYGVTVPRADGSMLVCQIVRCSARGEDVPLFTSGMELEILALHEWGHSFVNPVIDAQPDLVAGLKPHFSAVQEKMAKQAYPRIGTYANEQILRACVIVATREMHGNPIAERLIAQEERRGFLLTRAVVAQLDRFAKHRDKYPTFRQFAPELLAALAKEPVGRPM